MKILALRVRHVGRFAAATAIDGLSGGLDVLAEDNEFGKSTLFRALEAVFQVKHTATGAAVDRLRPYDGGEPLIEADFEVGGVRHRIRKQFGRGKSADLFDLASGRTLARGIEAEDALAGLTGMGDGRPSRFGLLWVGQRRSLEPADPDHDPAGRKSTDRGERQALQTVIEREIATMTSGQEMRLVRARVAELLDPLTGGRQKQPRTGSDFDRAIKERDAQAAALEAARKAEQKASEQVDRLEELIAHRAATCSDDALRQLDQRLAAARDSDERARAARQRFLLAEKARAEALTAAQPAAHALTEFDRKLEDLARLDDNRDRAAAQGSALAEAARSAASALSRALAELGAATAEEDAALASLAAHDAWVQRRALADRLEHASRALAVARRIEAEIGSAALTLQSNAMTAEALAAIEAADRDVSRLTDQLAAAAARIEFDLLPQAAGRVSIGGRPLKGQETVQADEPLRIDIEGIGTITVAAGTGTGAAELRLKLGQARAALESALGEARVTTVPEAQAARRERIAIEQGLALARQTLDNVAPDGCGALAAEVEALAGHHAEMADGQPLADRADGAARVARLKHQRIGLAAAVEAARASDGLARDALLRHTTTLDALATQRGHIAGALPPPEVRGEERARLRAAAAAAEAAVQDAVRTVAALAEAAPSEERLADLARAVTAAAGAATEARTAAQSLANEIRDIEIRLQASNDEETTRRVAAVSGALAAAEAEVERFAASARALTLLDEVLAAAERAMHDRFVRPVVERLQPYLVHVFPGATVQFGDGFAPAVLVRDGRGEPIDGLSDGTREQVAVLVRLAFGRLLADAGSPAPLILDDALVFSDDTRIARMFTLLTEASRHHQVIVLTCRSTLFDKLGGHRVTARPWAG